MNEFDRLNGKLIIALGRAYRNAHKLSNEMFREHNLTFPQFTVLEVLYSKGELTVQQIIDKVLSSSGNMTVVIRNLEQMELVCRRENPEDRRSFLIGLTEKGSNLMTVLFAGHMANLAEYFGNISPEEKETIVLLLKKFR